MRHISVSVDCPLVWNLFETHLGVSDLPSSMEFVSAEFSEVILVWDVCENSSLVELFTKHLSLRSLSLFSL